jgi:xanthine dehydrogenase YagS FAD-binding subunit
VVGIATVVESAGGVREPRVVMGRVAPIPGGARKAEEFLRGNKLDEAAATQAGEIALEGAKPLKDNVYKVKMAQDLIHKGLIASGPSTEGGNAVRTC